MAGVDEEQVQKAPGGIIAGHVHTFTPFSWTKTASLPIHQSAALKSPGQPHRTDAIFDNR